MFALCPLPAGVFAALDQISQVFGLRYRPGNSSGLAQKRPTRMHIPALPANTLLYRSCWARRGDSFRNNHPAILGIIELKLMIDSIKYSTVVGNIYKKSFNSVGRPRKELKASRSRSALWAGRGRSLKASLRLAVPVTDHRKSRRTLGHNAHELDHVPRKR